MRRDGAIELVLDRSPQLDEGCIALLIGTTDDRLLAPAGSSLVYHA